MAFRGGNGGVPLQVSPYINGYFEWLSFLFYKCSTLLSKNLPNLSLDGNSSPNGLGHSLMLGVNSSLRVIGVGFQLYGDRGSKGIWSQNKGDNKWKITSLRDVSQLCTKQVGTGEVFKWKGRALQWGKRVKDDPKETKRTRITNWSSTQGRSHRNWISKTRVHLAS